jgi:tRNA-binding protein
VSQSEETTIDQFLKIDVRVGTVIDATPFEKAKKPAYIMHIDFGDKIGVKKTSAQITALYDPDTLIGKQVAAVVNFPSRQIGPIMSEVLTLGFSDANGDIVLIHPERPVPNGQRMH